MVIGELVPKTVSLARAERVALLIARPFSWFLNTFRWAIDLLDGISGAIVRALGVSEPSGAWRRAFHRRTADSNSAGARTRPARARRREIHRQRDRTGAGAGARNHGAASRHARAAGGIDAGRSDARVCDDATVSHSGLSRIAKIRFWASCISRICFGCCWIASDGWKRILRASAFDLRSACCAKF